MHLHMSGQGWGKTEMDAHCARHTCNALCTIAPSNADEPVEGDACTVSAHTTPPAQTSSCVQRQQPHPSNPYHAPSQHPVIHSNPTGGATHIHHHERRSSHKPPTRPPAAHTIDSLYQRHTPFHTRPGSMRRVLSSTTSVDRPQNAGSSCVRNCSASGK